METKVWKVDPRAPAPEALATAAEILRRGGLVAFPTETVYGLGAHALDADAVARIFAAKGRPASNPVIVHVADAPSARPLVLDWPSDAELLAARFWPGPLTIVLPRAEVVPAIVAAGGPTVALRSPAHPVAQALLQASKLPIAAPSANLSTRISPTRASHVVRDLAGRVDMILDAGPAAGGLESTVVDLTARPARVLRPGLVTVEALERTLGAIAVGAAGAGSEIARSPGMQSRHYAPRVPVEIIAGDAAARVTSLCHAGYRVGWLAFEPATAPIAGAMAIAMPTAPADYASRLYAELHALEDAAVDRIVVSAPPAGDAWRAIHDRLRRAAAPA